MGLSDKEKIANLSALELPNFEFAQFI